MYLFAVPPTPSCRSPPELVLKVRIQNPSARENDFIEVELDRQELTYRSLLRVCCRELDISAEHVEKIRKLPNTMLRKVREGHTGYPPRLLPTGLAAISQTGDICDRRLTVFHTQSMTLPKYFKKKA